MSRERFTKSAAVGLNQTSSFNVDQAIRLVVSDAKKEDPSAQLVDVAYVYIPHQILITVILERNTP